MRGVQGSDTRSIEKVRRTWYRHYWGRPGEITTHFYCSTGTPTRMDHSVSNLCEVTWGRTVSLDSMTRLENPRGKTYYKLEFEIEMTCEGNMVDFVVYYQGEKVAGHEVNVDFESGIGS